MATINVQTGTGNVVTYAAASAGGDTIATGTATRPVITIRPQRSPAVMAGKRGGRRGRDRGATPPATEPGRDGREEPNAPTAQVISSLFPQRSPAVMAGKSLTRRPHRSSPHCSRNGARP